MRDGVPILLIVSVACVAYRSGSTRSGYRAEAEGAWLRACGDDARLGTSDVWTGSLR